MVITGLEQKISVIVSREPKEKVHDIEYVEIEERQKQVWCRGEPKKAEASKLFAVRYMLRIAHSFCTMVTCLHRCLFNIEASLVLKLQICFKNARPISRKWLQLCSMRGLTLVTLLISPSTQHRTMLTVNLLLKAMPLSGFLRPEWLYYYLDLSESVLFNSCSFPISPLSPYIELPFIISVQCLSWRG